MFIYHTHRWWLTKVIHQETVSVLYSSPENAYSYYPAGKNMDESKGQMIPGRGQKAIER